MKTKNEIQVRTYKVLTDCVTNGINFGYNKAFKHDDDPSEDYIKEMIEYHVMLEISENFLFPELEGDD